MPVAVVMSGYVALMCLVFACVCRRPCGFGVGFCNERVQGNLSADPAKNCCRVKCKCPRVEVEPVVNKTEPSKNKTAVQHYASMTNQRYETVETALKKGTIKDLFIQYWEICTCETDQADATVTV